MNFTVFVVDWDSLGPTKFLLFITAVSILSHAAILTTR